MAVGTFERTTMASQDTMSAQQAERPVEPLRSLHADMRPLLRHNLPLRQTSFVGRAMELAELAELLGASECRLLTLIGPGGIGKTRLAVEAAEAAQAMFAEGIAFAPLQAVSPTESIAPVLAEALGCTTLALGCTRLALGGGARARSDTGLRPRNCASLLLNGWANP